MKNQSRPNNSRSPGKKSFPNKNGAAKHAPRGPRVETSRGNQASDKGPKGDRAVTGTHALNEVLKVRPKNITEVWFVKGWESAHDLREINEKLKVTGKTPVVKSEDAMKQICFSHQGAVFFVNKKPELGLRALADKKKSKVLFVDGVEDPHNLGAIMRTGWLTGVDVLITPDDRAVGLTATVHKVACGGVEHLPIIKENQFSQTAEELKKMGYWIFGLSHKSKKSIFDLKMPEKVAWMVGSEDKGLRTTSEKLCDELVFIPQTSAAASYNASVATAIALAETLRQQNL